MSYTVQLDQASPCSVTEIAHDEHPIVARFADYRSAWHVRTPDMLARQFDFKLSADHFLQVMHGIQPSWSMHVEGGK